MFPIFEFVSDINVQDLKIAISDHNLFFAFSKLCYSIKRYKALLNVSDFCGDNDLNFIEANLSDYLAQESANISELQKRIKKYIGTNTELIIGQDLLSRP
jgi:hypothetical protein